MQTFRPRTPASALKQQLFAATRTARSYQRPIGTATGLATLGIARGSATVTWAGSTGYSNTVTVDHGLNVTPAAVLLGPSSMPVTPFAFIAFVNGSVTATSIPLAGATPGAVPAANTTGTIWWLAVL